MSARPIWALGKVLFLIGAVSAALVIIVLTQVLVGLFALVLGTVNGM